MHIHVTVLVFTSTYSPSKTVSDKIIEKNLFTVKHYCSLLSSNSSWKNNVSNMDALF